MTREELKENICGMTYDDMFEYIYSLEQRNAELEHWNSDLRLSVEAGRIRIKELEAPKTCGNCKWCIISCGMVVCSNAEFEPKTTLDTVCFMGYEPKDKE